MSENPLQVIKNLITSNSWPPMIQFQHFLSGACFHSLDRKMLRLMGLYNGGQNFGPGNWNFWSSWNVSGSSMIVSGSFRGEEKGKLIRFEKK